MCRFHQHPSPWTSRTYTCEWGDVLNHPDDRYRLKRNQHLVLCQVTPDMRILTRHDGDESWITNHLGLYSWVRDCLLRKRVRGPWRDNKNLGYFKFPEKTSTLTYSRTTLVTWRDRGWMVKVCNSSERIEGRLGSYRPTERTKKKRNPQRTVKRHLKVKKENLPDKFHTSRWVIKTRRIISFIHLFCGD